jgi:hypothetical protein
MPFEALVKDLTEKGMDATIAAQIVSNEKVAAALDEQRLSGLRQSEFDRKMNLGKAELAAEKQRIAEQATALETERTRMDQQFLTAQQEREAADMLNAQVLARAKTASAVYGVDLEKELFGKPDGTPPPARKEPAPAAAGTGNGDLGKRLDDLEGLFKAVPNLTVELQDIALQHATLFPDKPLVLKDILNKAVELRIPPTQVWDNLFGATQKRTELQAEKYRLEGEARARTKFEQEASKKAATPFGIQSPTSPIFAAAANKEHLNDRSKNMADAVARATEAMISHKYAPGYNRREA